MLLAEKASYTAYTPEDAARAAANSSIANAEGILQGQAEGDEVEVLIKAKQLLMCDPMHIPLRRTLDHLERLQRDIVRRTAVRQRGLRVD